MKRSLIITIAVVAIFVGIMLLLLFSRNNSPVPAGGTTGTLPGAVTKGGSNNGGFSPSQGLPVANGPTKFGLISNEPVIAYTNIGDKVLVVEPNGKIAEVTSGQVNFLSSSEIQSVLSAGFSFDGKRAFVNFGDPGSPQTSIFDVKAKAWAPLTAGIVSPVWSPADSRIAYLKNNTDGTVSLATLDTSKTMSKSVTLINFMMQDLAVTWPNKSQIVLSDKPSIYAQGSAWLFDFQKGTLTQAIAPNFGLEAAWSATTSTMALAFWSEINGLGGSISLVSPVTSNIQNLTFLTLPSKCTFNYETSPAATSTLGKAYLVLYCAIPTDRDRLGTARLPDDYEQMALFTNDTFYKVRTDSGAIELVFTPGISIDAASVRILNKTLFFINRYDKKLYAISLP
jgi:hypothetical protein